MIRINFKQISATKIITGIISCLSIFLLFAFFNQAVFAEDTIVDNALPLIPKLAHTANDPELSNGYVNPNWGAPCQTFTYYVTYRDKNGRKPRYIKIYINGTMYNMQKADSKASSYKKGVTYYYKIKPNKIGSIFYFYEASNGLGKARAGIIDSPSNGPVLFSSTLTRNQVVLINLTQNKKVWVFNTNKEWVGGVAISDNGKYVAVKTSYHLYFFNTSSNKPVWTYQIAAMNRIGDDIKGGIAMSADGSKIFTSLGSSALLFSKSSARPLWQYSLKTSVYSVDISADGKYAAVGTVGEASNVQDNLLIFWKTSSSRPLWQYHSSGNFHDVSISSNGSWIAGATGCPDRRTYLFSKASNKPIFRSEMLTRDSPVHRSQISADGKYFAVGTESDQGALYFYKRGSKTAIWKFPTPENSSVRALSLSQDGKYIGAAAMGGHAYIFNTASAEPVSHWVIDASLGAAAITESGKKLVVGGTDKKIHIFQSDMPEEIAAITANEFIDDISISKNEKFAVAGTSAYQYFFETSSSSDDKIYQCK